MRNRIRRLHQAARRNRGALALGAGVALGMILNERKHEQNDLVLQDIKPDGTTKWTKNGIVWNVKLDSQK